MSLTVWQVASAPFWVLAVYLFVYSTMPFMTKAPLPTASEKIVNRLIASGFFAYIAAKFCS